MQMVAVQNVARLCTSNAACRSAAGSMNMLAMAGFLCVHMHPHASVQVACARLCCLLHSIADYC